VSTACKKYLKGQISRIFTDGKKQYNNTANQALHLFFRSKNITFMELEMSTSTTVLGCAITAGLQRASRQTINTSKIAYGFDSRLARTAWFTSASVELAGRASPPCGPVALSPRWQPYKSGRGKDCNEHAVHACIWGALASCACVWTYLRMDGRQQGEQEVGRRRLIDFFHVRYLKAAAPASTWAPVGVLDRPVHVRTYTYAC
jgi:hypothetical protein